jgi:IS30 family transposase
VEAMQALLSNEEMTDEIRSEIERRVQQLGNEQVANGLKMHEESLLKEVRRNDTKEDILTLVEQEISDLKTYVESLVRLV